MIPFLLATVIAEAIAIVAIIIAPFGDAGAGGNLLFRFWSWSTHDAVAVYTLILSVSTIALWAATRRSAQIAERALSEVERPWLFVQGATVTRRDMPPVPLTPNFWYISFKCKNVGRSPAVMQECIIKLADKDLLPAAPDYRNAPPFSTQRWVSPGEEFETPPMGPGNITMKNGEPIRFVVYGRLTYTELNGRVHHTGFAVEVSPHMAAFMGFPNDAYDYYD